MFELLASTPRAPVDMGDSPNIPQLRLDAGGDYWAQSGTTWPKHHKVYRMKNYHPADGQARGPNIAYLEEKRITLKVCQDDQTKGHEEGSWKEDDKTTSDDRRWTGHTVLYDLGSYPQAYHHDVMEECRLPHQTPTLMDPTPEERELHQLTHTPCRSRCKVCIRSKARGTYHHQQYGRKPLLQTGYGFSFGKDRKQEIPVLSCIDGEPLRSTAKHRGILPACRTTPNSARMRSISGGYPNRPRNIHPGTRTRLGVIYRPICAGGPHIFSRAPR